MNDGLRFTPPEITDEDVAWACEVLKLPKTAFSGADGNDPRLAVLKSTGMLDIEACPGSGKTTLLVAKLAVLARRWTESRRGICVLSHTNVARREIEHSLGSTAAGQRLLAYPHFVGTIHGFVNEFLAMPWLRSLGYPVRVIDDEICQARRWGKIPRNTKIGLEKNSYEAYLLKIADTEFGIGDIRWGKGTLGKATETYRAIQSACRLAAQEGFHCYDEMFVWANDLLTKLPDMCSPLRERFPFLFIDEVQDNSELQSSLLHRLFIAGGHPAIRQRYGDSNQAIYQHAGDNDGATTDPFPDPAIRKDIPNSHRFAQEIADLAKPLGLVTQNLVGYGPPTDKIKTDTTGKHAIFLFSDKTLGCVVSAYARYLQELFPVQEIRDGAFTIVGAVHRPGEEYNLPRFVGHYWADYDHELTASEPKPKTFLQYVMAGRRLAQMSGEAHHIVERTADGLLRLARMANPLANLPTRKYRHRQIMDLLTTQPEMKSLYLELIVCLATEPRIPSAEEWTNKWLGIVISAAEAIGGIPVDRAATAEFMNWQPFQNEAGEAGKQRQRDNIFRHPPVDPAVQIRVGSIHSVKGETHTATLVLDTFFFGHHLATLKPWLLGKKSGKGAEKVRNQSRLKQHYVAMTRPTHLLCLAIKEDVFLDGEIAELRKRGWRIARVGDARHEWLEL